MLKQRFQRFFCLLVLVTAVGCSSSGPFVGGTDEAQQRKVGLTTELKSLYNAVAAESGKAEALDGYADLYLKTPKHDRKAYCTVQLRKSGDARLIVTAGFLNWPVADVLVRPDSLFVHDMLSNRLFVGRNNPENLGKVVGVDAGVSQMMETLFGMPGVSEPMGAIVSVGQGGGKVSYTVKAGSGRKVLLVDPVTKVIEGITLFDRSGSKIVEFRYSDFQAMPGAGATVRVPKSIDMMLFKAGRSDASHQVKVVYDESVVNPPGLSINFRMPKRARMVNLDEVERLPWM